MDEYALADVQAKQQAVLETALADGLAFRVWLAAHDADAVVGYVRDGFTCPVAAWLSEQTQEVARVMGPWIWVGGSPLLAMPDWMRAFTRAVDAIAREVLLGIDVPVTAAQAVAVFDAVVSCA